MSTDILNKRIALFYRAKQISNIYREKFGMKPHRYNYEFGMPEFQEKINTTHCWNKYMKALRERYNLKEMF